MAASLEGAGREELRESIARWLMRRDGFSGFNPVAKYYEDADALIAGPLAALIAGPDATRSEAAEQRARAERLAAERAHCDARIRNQRAVLREMDPSAPMARVTESRQVLVGLVRSKSAALRAAVARAERAEAAIRDIITGEYDGPHRHRNTQCRHGIWSWDACENCIDEHLSAALAPQAPASDGETDVRRP